MATAGPALCGLSRDVTLAVLPRLFIEELVAELTRRNISFGGYSFKREVLAVMLKDAMTQEYRNLELETYPPDDVSDDINAEVMPDVELAEREQFQSQILQKYSQTLSRICPSPNIQNSPWPETATRSYDEKDTITIKESRTKYNPMSSEAYPDTNAPYNSSATSVSAREDQTAMESASECREPETSSTTRPIPQLGDFFSPKTELEDDKTQNDEVLYSINPDFQSGNTSNSTTPELTAMLDPDDTDQPGDVSVSEAVLQNSENVSAHSNDEEAALCVDVDGENGAYDTNLDVNKTRNDDESDSRVFHDDKKTSSQYEPSTSLEPQGTMLYTCDKCDYRTKLKHNLVKHSRIHTGEKPFLCPYCDYRANRRDYLKAHMYRHVGKKPKPHQCGECEFKTTHKSHLVQHMRKHTGEKPFMCDRCGFRAAHKTSMDYHMKKHVGGKSHVCNVCGYRAQRESQLVVHQRKHTGEKPFMCGECGFRTAHKTTMDYHVKTHVGDRPHVCNVCGYRAIKEAQLVVHQRKHTGEKPYVCGHCDFKSAHKASLFNHMKLHTEKQ